MGIMNSFQDWRNKGIDPNASSADQANQRKTKDQNLANSMGGTDDSMIPLPGQPMSYFDKGGTLPKINLHDGNHKLVVAEAGERILTPEQNHDYEAQHPDARKEPMVAEVYDGSGVVGGSEISEATPLGKSIANRTQELYAQAKDGGQNVMDPKDPGSAGRRRETNAVLNAVSSRNEGDPAAPYVPSANDRVHPLGQAYGSRPGEQRIYTDPEGNAVNPTTPQGLGAVGPKAPIPTALGKLPMYDDGGKVKAEAEAEGQDLSKHPGESALDVMQQEESNYRMHERAHPEPADRTTPEGMGVKPLPRPSVPMNKLPMYDDGGTVQTEEAPGQAQLDDEKLKVAAHQQAIAEHEQALGDVPLGHGQPQAREAAQDSVMHRYPQPQKPARLQYDTEKPVDESKGVAELGGDARMNADNAPLSKPVMNNQNAAPWEVNPVQEISAKKTPLGPQVAPQSAEMKQLPGQVATEPAPGQAELDKDQVKSEGEAVAPDLMKIVQADKLAAMQKGTAGLADLGTSLIHEKALMPKYTGAGKPVAEGELAPQKDIKLEKQAEGKAKYQQTVDAYRDKMLHGATEQIRYQAEKDLANYKLHTPWGGDESAHPGMLGKIGHVLGQVGQTALSASAPYVNAGIPGSQVGLHQEVARGAQGVEQAQKEEETAAETKRKAEVPIPQQLANAQAELRAAQASGDPQKVKDAQVKVDDATAVLQSGKVQLKESGLQQQYLDAETELANAKTPAEQQAAQSKMDRIKTAASLATVNKPETAEADKLSYESTVAKVAGAGFPTNPDSVTRSLAAALKAGKITQDEYNHAAGYREANPPASTKIELMNEAAASKAEAKKAGSYYTYTDDEGTHLVTGDKLPAGMDSTPIKDVNTFITEARSGNIVQESLNTVRKDVDEHPEIFDNGAARKILATTLEQIDRSAVGMLIAGTGGQIPMPSGVGDMINADLQNDALDHKTASALKQYIADYKNMKDKAIVQQMQMQGGKIGRASQVALQAIINQIPNGSTPDSKTAKRQFENLQRTQDDLMAKYPSEYQDYKKTEPYKAGETKPVERHPDVPSAAQSQYRDKSGNVVGYKDAQGNYVALK